jgi:hypothetical protein
MGGLREGRITSKVAEEIVAVNISLLQMSHWCFLFFGNKEEPLVSNITTHARKFDLK